MKDAIDPDDAPLPPSLAALGLANHAPYLMNRIMGRYNAALRGEMRRLGLSTAKMRALAVLSVLEGIKTGDLADFAVVEPSTLSRALDGLEADGLVQRMTDDADNRATLVALTPAGYAANARLWPHMAQAQARLFRGIPEAERRAFVGTLRQMLVNAIPTPTETGD